MFQTKLTTTTNHLKRGFKLLAVAAAVVMALPMLAAPPVNDDLANAFSVTEPLPFTHSVSTVDATSGSDPVVCFEATHTVWYSYTPTTTGPFTVDTFGSDYDTILEAYYLAPENGYFAGCSDDAGTGVQSSLGLWGTQGEAIYFLVGSGNGSPGGNLVLNVNRVTAPVVTVSVVEPVQFNPANGGAHVRLRIESSSPITVIIAVATIIQPNGRGDIAGTELVQVFQTGTSFEVAIPAIFNIGNDRSHGTGFKGGPARLIGFVSSYYGPGNSFIDNVQLDQPIRLKAAPRK